MSAARSANLLFSAHHGRRRSRSEPELRAAQRLQPADAPSASCSGTKAEVIEYDHQEIRTPRTEFFPRPHVIRLQYLIRRPRPRVQLTPPRGLRARPPHLPVLRPQTHDLTLDHVIPRHRGGPHTWDNLVTACKPCNHRKGGQDARRGAAAPDPSAVRAAQRRLLAVHAVPRRRAQRGVADVPVPRRN